MRRERFWNPLKLAFWPADQPETSAPRRGLCRLRHCLQPAGWGGTRLAGLVLPCHRRSDPVPLIRLQYRLLRLHIRHSPML